MGETIDIINFPLGTDSLLIWTFYISAAFFVLNLLGNESDDDDDQNGGMMVPAYQTDSV